MKILKIHQTNEYADLREKVLYNQKQIHTHSLKKGYIDVVLISCKRMNLLQQTCESLFQWHDRYNDLKNETEFTIVDNGSGKELIKYAERLQRFKRIISNQQNLGLAKAINQGYSATNGEFILHIEDDWLCRSKLPFLSMGIKVLREFSEIGTVLLKANQFSINKGIIEGFNIRFKRWPDKHLDKRWIGELRGENPKFYTFLPVPGWPNNVYGFSCCLFKRVIQQAAGLLPENIANHAVEEVYASRVEKYCLGSKIEHIFDVFHHIGDKQKSPGWLDAGMK